MSPRQSNIDALLHRADGELAKIEIEYQNSLQAKNIDTALRIDIKNLFENLRSVLDYLARDVRQEFCAHARPGDRFYFPIMPDQSAFNMAMDKWYPRLRDVAPGLFADLEAVQPYHAEFKWLGDFNRLNNSNKHGDLVEQARKETVETVVTGEGGGRVSWSGNVKFFGSGVSVMGVPIDPRTQLPVPSPKVKVDRITWVDFRFAESGAPALDLIKESLEGVKAINLRIRAHLH